MSRFDSIGLFWQDAKEKGRRGVAVQRNMPPIPETGWRPPTEYPNLSSARIISVDTETYDPYLLTHGPGWARQAGHIVGVSIAVETGHRWYFPIRHEVQPELNLSPEHTMHWLRDTLGNPRQDKVGANILYDAGWLEEEGAPIKGRIWDVQFAEALLSEDGRVALDELGTTYLGIGKQTSLLYQWCADYYGGKPNEKQRANIYRSPASLVGPYAEMDAVLPLQILNKQWTLLHQQNLLHVFDMECRLIPLIIKMRRLGVSVDLQKAEELIVRLNAEKAEKGKLIKNMVGFEVNPLASDSLARAFSKLGLEFPRTTKNAPSFTKPFLQSVEHPIGDLIREWRERDKLVGTFLKSYILNSHINGKIYCQFHPMRGDDNGTRSGRFSSSTPNLQNIPARTDLGRLLRQIFIPDAGHVQWRKYDYSQIEYRFLAHFAVGPGSDDIRAAYRSNRKTDYHDALTALIHRMARIMLDRKNTKTINFGLTYGMGQSKLIHSLGLSAEAGAALFEAYHTGAPFVKATMDATMKEAQLTGYITTLLGRRSRFDLWEPRKWGKERMALPYDKAVRIYGSVQRAYTHKALNRRLQGSSADQLKTAMLMCYEGGVFDRIGYPRLTVHDELDFSDFGGVEDGYAELQHIMENCLQLRIPVLAEESTGPNWGACA